MVKLTPEEAREKKHNPVPILFRAPIQIPVFRGRLNMWL
jgi:hypothetical protein